MEARIRGRYAGPGTLWVPKGKTRVSKAMYPARTRRTIPLIRSMVISLILSPPPSGQIKGGE
jgi:hypothetical protein